MTVYKRKGSDIYQVEFEFKGRRIRRSSNTTKKREAEEFERRLREQLRKQINLGQVAEMTFGEAIDRYWDTVIVPKNNPEAAKKDAYALNTLRKHFGEGTALQEFTAPVITDYRDGLLAEDKAPGTANRYLAILKAILNKAKDEWGALAVVPSIKLLPLNNARHRWLRDEEEARLLAECAPHLRDLVVFLLDTGARKGEALGLTWADVDLERSPRGLVKFMKTKNQKPRSVPLTDRVKEMLIRLREQKPEGVDHVFLYRSGKGKSAPIQNPQGAWAAACDRASVENATIHDLRHTFASRLVMKNVPLLTVSRLLGHSDLKMTMRYAHLAPEMFDEAIDALGF